MGKTAMGLSYNNQSPRKTFHKTNTEVLSFIRQLRLYASKEQRQYLKEKTHNHRQEMRKKKHESTRLAWRNSKQRSSAIPILRSRSRSNILLTSCVSSVPIHRRSKEVHDEISDSFSESCVNHSLYLKEPNNNVSLLATGAKSEKVNNTSLQDNRRCGEFKRESGAHSLSKSRYELGSQDASKCPQLLNLHTHNSYSSASDILYSVPMQRYMLLPTAEKRKFSDIECSCHDYFNVIYGQCHSDGGKNMGEFPLSCPKAKYLDGPVTLSSKHCSYDCHDQGYRKTKVSKTAMIFDIHEGRRHSLTVPPKLCSSTAKKNSTVESNSMAQQLDIRSNQKEAERRSQQAPQLSRSRSLNFPEWDQAPQPALADMQRYNKSPNESNNVVSSNIVHTRRSSFGTSLSPNNVSSSAFSHFMSPICGRAPNVEFGRSVTKSSSGSEYSSNFEERRSNNGDIKSEVGRENPITNVDHIWEHMNVFDAVFDPFLFTSNEEKVRRCSCKFFLPSSPLPFDFDCIYIQAIA